MESIILLILAFLGATLADHGHHNIDPMDDIPRMKDFEMDRILGNWYIMMNGPIAINDTEFADVDCMEERIQKNRDNQYLYDFTFKLLVKSTKTYTTINGLTAIADPKKPSEAFYFSDNKVLKGLIVGTDYINFVVSSNYDEKLKMPVYWIASRKQSLDPTVTSTILSFLGIDRTRMKEYDFSTCPKMIQSNSVDEAAEETPTPLPLE